MGQGIRRVLELQTEIRRERIDVVPMTGSSPGVTLKGRVEDKRSEYWGGPV